jgi:hypothetical protein
MEDTHRAFWSELLERLRRGAYTSDFAIGAAMAIGVGAVFAG